MNFKVPISVRCYDTLHVAIKGITLLPVGLVRVADDWVIERQYACLLLVFLLFGYLSIEKCRPHIALLY